jgi:kynurenine formamidase
MADLPRWRKRPPNSNWGEFGADDQIGRMNLITPEIRRQAFTEVRDGLTFCLSLPLDYPGGSVLSSIRKPPRLIASQGANGQQYYNLPIGVGTGSPRGVGCDDAVLLYTQYSTQWDALAHWGARFDADDDGQAEIVYYNGYRGGEHILSPGDSGSVNGESPAESEYAPKACALGIETLAETCVQGRAVVVSLLEEFGSSRTWVDLPRLLSAMSNQAVELRTGDFLLLHTGFDDALLAMNRNPDKEALEQTGAVLDGRDERLLRWVQSSGLVAICSDNMAVEGVGYADAESPSRTMLPLHDLCLFKQGIFLGELWRLGDLARWLCARKRVACLLTAPPLRLPGLVGSPVTPVATV